MPAGGEQPRRFWASALGRLLGSPGHAGFRYQAQRVGTGVRCARARCDLAARPRVSPRRCGMNALLAFAAALVSLRLAASLLGRYRGERARRELAAWAAALLAYAVASAALAWGAAGGWNDASFRVYYLTGALLTAPLLGVGSLFLVGVRAAAGFGIAYCGLAVGTMIAVPLTETVSGTAIPAAQDHLDLFPARVLAIAGNSLGTLAVVIVVALTFRRRPLGNALILAGVVVAAVGSAVSGLGEAGTSVFIVAAALLLYAGFLSPLRQQPEPGNGVEHHERKQGVLRA